MRIKSQKYSRPLQVSASIGFVLFGLATSSLRVSRFVWLRFTTDGYLGVVASSNDINFNYNHNSGKLIKSVKKEWCENKIIIVPLPTITSRQERLLIEKMIGNYLIDNNVPIIDYYSHNLGN